MDTRRSAHWFRTLTFALLSLAVARTVFPITLDPTFAIGGRFVTSFAATGEPSSAANAVFMQPQARIIVTGSHSQQGTTGRTVGIAIAGLTVGGVLDNSFGTAGKVVVWSPVLNRYPTNSLVLDDGSIVVFYRHSESLSSNRPGLMKFSPTGQHDPAFDPDLNLFPNATYPVVAAKASSGKIYTLVRNGYQHYLIRLNSDGSRDGTFAPNGVRSVPLQRFGTEPRVSALEELPNGKILLAGGYYAPLGYGQTFVTRFDANGNIDRSFGIQGTARLAVDGGHVETAKILVQPDGKVLVAGAWTFLGSNTYLARLTARGRPDAGFGDRGVVMTSFNNLNMIHGIALGSDGRVHVAGTSGVKAVPSNPRLFVIRYSAAGVQESSLVSDFASGSDSHATNLLLQADGKVVVCGYSTGSNGQLAAARFLP
ncbi:MAG TPA: hypothetical protein VNA22_09745 [Pyrinomonadaceae bacterium]|nr:hypothetical protein [Pyrinomonadaceae bacterium]